MTQLINYIKNGKGVGLIIVLAAAVLSTIVLMLAGRHYYSQARPQIMLIAEDLLPITIQNGKIVKPTNIYKKIDLNLGKPDEIFPIVLDTRQETSSVPSAKQGLFIMTDKIYTISSHQMRIFNLDDGVWDKDSFKAFLDYFSGIVFGVLAIIAAAMMFLVYLFKTWVLSVLGFIGVKAMKKGDKFDFSALMRLSALLICTMEVISFTLNTISRLNITGMQIFILAVVLEWLFIGKEPAKEA